MGVEKYSGGLASCFNYDPCGEAHPDIIVGPMADGDTGRIVRDAVI